MNAGDVFRLALARGCAGDSLSQSARVFAANDIPVFPCAPGGKRPAVARGFHSASTSTERVSQWWSTMPTANIGMPTGAASGLVVVDVDIHDSVNGYAALGRAQQEGLLNGWIAAVRTASGGLHLYFPAGGDSHQNSWQSARAGIDFRGDGGYIILPPSTRIIDGDKRNYSISQVAPGAGSALDARRLRDFLDPPRRSKFPSSGAATMATADVARLVAWVSRLQEGERNHGLFWAACKLAEQRLSAGEAFDALVPAGDTAGLSEREIKTTIRSAYRTVQGPPSQRSLVNARATPAYRSQAGAESRNLT